MRKLGVLFAFMFMLLAVPTVANAAITDVFAGKIPCTTQGPGPDQGQRWCAGPGGNGNAHLATVNSWDGSPIDVNVGFPNEAVYGPGPYPLAMFFHGFGGGKEGLGGDLQRFLDQGIAVFSMTERGFNNSCGSPAAITALESNGQNCSKGFIHLMDTRYEVRDSQYLAGILADQGVIQPKKIGTVGASYGGGKSMALGALKNRIMLPDGNYAPWKSPGGTDMEIAAAAPIVPWTDFAYSLLPNGRTLDYVKDSPYKKPFGVLKSGIVSALLPSGDNFSGQFGVGNETADPSFDILGWKAVMDAGEPYDSPTADVILNEMTQHHSSYYIDDSVKPAPMLIAQGLMDDLFPIDEPLRYYNRTKANYPDADISLLFADVGHPRAPLAGVNAQGRPADIELGYQRVDNWFAHYLKGEGPKPANQSEVKTMVCPYEEPSGGPFTAANWASMSKGEIRMTDPATRMINADAGDDDLAIGFSTVLSSGCSQKAETVEPGTIDYTFSTVPAGGLTLMGAPTVIADISVPNGGESEIAARLFEVKDGLERVVARGLYRPDASGPQVIQLHGNAYNFEAGAKIRLQLLPKDGTDVSLASYGRPSNLQQDITVKNAEIRIPVAEAPGTAGGMVTQTSPKVLPTGSELAPDYAGVGSIPISEWNKTGEPNVGPLKMVARPTVKGKKMRVNMLCSAKFDSCSKATVAVRATGKVRGVKKPLLAKRKGITVGTGKTKRVYMNLTKKARKIFRNKTFRKKGKKKVRKGAKKVRSSILINGKKNGVRTVLRIGKVR